MSEQNNTLQKIAEMTGYSHNEIALVKNTIAKGTTDVELAYFLNIAKGTGLNPFMREVWCYKDNKGNLLVFAGRDGFLKRAQESKLWNGMTSAEVCNNDEFEIDIPSATIKHKPNVKDRGDIIGAYAIVKPKDCEFPTVEWVSFDVYNKGFNAWRSHPAEMIKKVAEVHALKKAFGITGLNCEDDFVIRDNIAIDLEPSKPVVKGNIANALAAISNAPDEKTVSDIESKIKLATWTDKEELQLDDAIKTRIQILKEAK